MFGNYEINNGSYNFNFQRLTSWKFDIEKNSTIIWNGDPSEARVNIMAKYSLPKVSLYNLVGQGTSASNDKLATRTEKVDVLINLRGALLKPDITYSIELPEVGSLAYESGVAAHLKEINNDQNKALFQVWGLLFSNQFLPDDATSTAAANVGITGKNSVGQALSAQAQAILNNITGALLKGSGIGVNVNYRAYNVGGPLDNSSVDRNQVSAGITSNLFNNRFRLYAGGDYDWGRLLPLPIPTVLRVTSVLNTSLRRMAVSVSMRSAKRITTYITSTTVRNPVWAFPISGNTTGLVSCLPVTASPAPHSWIRCAELPR